MDEVKWPCIAAAIIFGSLIIFGTDANDVAIEKEKTKRIEMQLELKKIELEITKLKK